MSKRFSRVALLGRTEDARVGPSMSAFAVHLLGRGLEVLVDEQADPQSMPAGVQALPMAELARRADLIVTVGGDGTMLYAAQQVIGRPVPLLGINRGRLGFLADVSGSEMTEIFDAVLAGQFEQDVRTLLSARIERPGRDTLYCLALNDVVIQKYGTGRMIDLETWIGGAFVNDHSGDGLVIATSTGSTAYALSCGGPIIHPQLDALVLAPISPHTLSNRPIVVGCDSEIEVRLAREVAGPGQVTYDGVVMGDLAMGDRLVVRAGPGTVTLLHPRGYDFFRILRSKLHWGRSALNEDREA